MKNKKIEALVVLCIGIGMGYFSRLFMVLSRTSEVKGWDIMASVVCALCCWVAIISACCIYSDASDSDKYNKH